MIPWLAAGHSRLQCLGTASYWTFDEALEDAIGDNDAVFTATAAGEPTYVENFDGKAQGAISFDGIDCATVLPTVQREMTIAYWVRLDRPQVKTTGRASDLFERVD